MERTARGVVLRRVPRAALAMAMMAALVAAPAAIAATPEHYEFTESFTYDDCGFPVEARYHETGMYLLKRDGLEMGHSSWSIVDTNPATGAWFRRSAINTAVDIRVQLVEGSIYRFTTTGAGQRFLITDMNGKRILFDRGSSAITYLLDTKGDDDPDNDEVVDGSIETIRDSGPRPVGAYFADHEWCDLVTSLIG